MPVFSGRLREYIWFMKIFSILNFMLTGVRCLVLNVSQLFSPLYEHKLKKREDIRLDRGFLSHSGQPRPRRTAQVSGL
jgi:hypothetical protein